MDSWNSDAFDSELRSVLNRHSELIVAYHSEDSCLMFEHLNSDPYESLKSNKFSQEYIRFLEKTVVPLVSYRRVRVWHYTRLLDEEANAMSEQLEASTLDRLKRRLSFLVEKCLIEEGDANTIFQQSVFHSQASGRSCRFWTTTILLPSNDDGVSPLLSSWGGESAYFWLEDKKLASKLKKSANLASSRWKLH